jgi:histidine triad (HIT) family protein
MYDYDDGNIFARILRGEIPNDAVAETEFSLAFNDIRPQAPVHVLVIPKGRYVCHDHFAADASDEEVLDFMRLSARIIRDKGLVEGGYRMIANAGEAGVQEVPHYHLHILGGRELGRMLNPA